MVEFCLLAGGVAAVLALLLGVAIAAVILPAPVVPAVLLHWPSNANLYVNVLRAAIRKKKAPENLIGKEIQVELARPVAFDTARYAAYLRLVGFKDVPGQLPFSYPFVESFRLSMLALTHPDFPFPVLGSVLARNTSSLSRPLSATEALTYRASINPCYEKNDKGDIEIQINCSGTDSSGDEVYRNTLTVIVINPKRQRGAGSKKPAPGEAADSTPPRLLAELSVPSNAGRQFGALSGDRNPIHMHPLLSQLFGFKRPIAHAMYLVCRLEAELHNAGFAPKSFPASFSTEFKRPTPLPAKLQVVVSPDAKPPLQCAVKTGDGAKDVIVGRLFSSS